MRSVVVQGVSYGFDEFFGRLNRARALNSRRSSGLGKINLSGSGDRRFSVGGFVLPVVLADMDEVFRLMQADRRERAEIHPQGSIAIEDKNLASRNRCR